MALRLLIPLALLLVAGGFAGGLWGWRYLDRLDDAPRPQRPALLEDAWNAWDAHDPAALTVALDDLPATFGDPAWDREAELLRLLATGAWDGVRTFADRHVDDPSGAQALRALIERSDDVSQRTVLEALLAERFPASSYVRKEP